MKPGLGALVLLVAIAGCAAPTAGPTPPEKAPTPTPTTAPDTAPPSPTASPAPTTSATSAPTPTGPTQDSVGATVTSLAVSDRAVVATIRVTNYGDTPARSDLAFRFVENDSHAIIGQTELEPGASETFEVPLDLYGDDPADLTVQVRVNGTIVAERAVPAS